MSSIPENQLIGQKEASLILGFKTNQQVSKYIKEGILTKFEKPGSKLIWVSKKQVLELPKPLPVPPPEDVFKTLKVNERWKKKD
jgi:predicted SPOUT superfamily RNA methylase MTH1